MPYGTLHERTVRPNHRMLDLKRQVNGLVWREIVATIFGAWLSPVERTVRVREAAGSNPAAPTAALMGIHSVS